MSTAGLLRLLLLSAIWGASFLLITPLLPAFPSVAALVTGFSARLLAAARA